MKRSVIRISFDILRLFLALVIIAVSVPPICSIFVCNPNVTQVLLDLLRLLSPRLPL